MFSGNPNQRNSQEEAYNTARRLNSAGIGTAFGGWEPTASGRVVVKDKDAFQNVYDNFLAQARQEDDTQALSPDQEAYYRKGLEQGHWKGNPLAKKYGLEGMISPQEDSYYTSGQSGQRDFIFKGDIGDMYNNAVNATRNLFNKINQF